MTKLTFRALGRPPLTGTVRNPNAKLGTVAARLAAKFGLAGTFECLGPTSEVLDPQMRLADLPNSEILLAPDLTPA